MYWNSWYGYSQYFKKFMLINLHFCNKLLEIQYKWMSLQNMETIFLIIVPNNWIQVSPIFAWIFASYGCRYCHKPEALVCVSGQLYDVIKSKTVVHWTSKSEDRWKPFSISCENQNTGNLFPCFPNEFHLRLFPAIYFRMASLQILGRGASSAEKGWEAEELTCDQVCPPPPPI